MPTLEAGLNWIRLATPTTDDRRLPTVLTNTSGFVYYVSITGITGASGAAATDVAKAVQAPEEPHRPAGRLSVFGIKTAGPGGRRGARRRCGGRRHRLLPDGGRRSRSGWCTRQRLRRQCAGACQAIGRRRQGCARMSWLTNLSLPKIRDLVRKSDTPENLWDKCPECEQMVVSPRSGSGHACLSPLRFSHTYRARRAACQLVRQRRLHAYRIAGRNSRSFTFSRPANVMVIVCAKRSRRPARRTP